MFALPPCPDCGAQLVDAQLTHEPTCPAGNGLDAVTQDDAKYFEDHPGEQIWVRPISHAEICEWLWVDGVEVDADAYILVRNIKPGFRTRMPMIKLELDGGRRRLITQRGDSVTLIGAPILAAAYRCVLLGIRTRRHNGLPSGDLQQLARALRRAHESHERHTLAPDDIRSATIERSGTARRVVQYRRSIRPPRTESPKRSADGPGSRGARVHPGRPGVSAPPGAGPGTSRATEGGGGMTSGPTDYPSNWPGARNQPAPPAAPTEALMLALDAFVASLSDAEFQALVARTRG